MIGSRHFGHQAAKEVGFGEQLCECEGAGRLDRNAGKNRAASQEEPAFGIFQAQAKDDANEPVKEALGPISFMSLISQGSWRCFFGIIPMGHLGSTSNAGDQMNFIDPFEKRGEVGRFIAAITGGYEQ